MVKIDDVMDQMKITRADHLPVIAAFCRRVNLIEIINRVVPTEMNVSVGTIIQGMVLDTLSGRSPLYRLTNFFKHQDTELLLGEDIDPISTSDHFILRNSPGLTKTSGSKRRAHLTTKDPW